MENSNHDETLLARWLADELTAAELESLQHREDFADLQAIVDGMKGLEMPAFSEQASWEKLQVLLKAEPNKAAGGSAGGSLPISEGENLISEAVANAAAILSEMPVAVISEREKPAPVTATAVERPPVQNIPTVTTTPPPKPLHTTIPAAETPVRTINRRQWLYAAAAAVALLLVALLWLRKSDPSSGYDTSIVTKAGQQTKADLPDGSNVELNALTTLAFTDSDWDGEREVYLKGEAFFRAKKGNTFTVLTEQGNVKVIGTQFNVYAREKTLEVKCTEGTVQVFNPKGTEKVLIKKGEQVSVVNGRMQRRAGIDFTPKWFKGESVFRSASRSRVFGEIERQYGVTVIGEGLEEKPFSGKFVNSDLEKALKMVAVPMGLKYEMRNDTVWFSTK